jgi:hypothetical protein
VHAIPVVVGQYRRRATGPVSGQGPRRVLRDARYVIVDVPHSSIAQEHRNGLDQIDRSIPSTRPVGRGVTWRSRARRQKERNDQRRTETRGRSDRGPAMRTHDVRPTSRRRGRADLARPCQARESRPASFGRVVRCVTAQRRSPNPARPPSQSHRLLRASGSAFWTPLNPSSGRRARGSRATFNAGSGARRRADRRSQAAASEDFRGAGSVVPQASIGGPLAATSGTLQRRERDRNPGHPTGLRRCCCG